MPKKKQHLLFDLSGIQRHKDRKPVSPERACEASVPLDEAPVHCPVCGKAMAPFDMHLRIQHVEACLTSQLLQEETTGIPEGKRPDSGRESSRHGTTSPKPFSVQYKAHVEAMIVTDSEPYELNQGLEDQKLEVLDHGLERKENLKIQEDLKLKENLKLGEDMKLEENLKSEEDLKIKETLKSEEISELEETSELEEVPKLGENLKLKETSNLKENLEQELKQLTQRFDSKKVPGKKKRPMGAIQNENLMYINSKPSVKKPRRARVEEPPTELLPSTRKREIPELKVMRFSVCPQTEYCVSVDAFSFKPSESIHQYFLSHFHSDHYGGISKRWCRERTLDSKIIYCSEITGRLLQIRYNIDPGFIFSMRNNLRYRVHSYEDPTSEACVSYSSTPGLYATTIDANHCPGAVIFLFESISMSAEQTFYLHCGDFRVCQSIMKHPMLQRFLLGGHLKLHKVYLDTTYMSAKYNFPKQEQVCESMADLVEKLLKDEHFSRQYFGKSMQSRITDLLSLNRGKKKLLVLVGTYLIGKERLAAAISQRCGNAPIYVSNIKSRGDKEEIIRSYKDQYLSSVLTTDPTHDGPHTVMIHLVPMSTAANIQDIAKYFNHNQYHRYFERCIGIRPTGWSFQNKESQEDSQADEPDRDISKATYHESKEEMLQEEERQIAQEVRFLRKHPEYSYLDIVKQSTPKRYGKVDSSLYRSFSVPYSEHSSYRELSFFTIFFNIQSVIPTVNTGNEWSVRRMNHIIRRWERIREMLKTGMGHELSLDDF